MTDIPIELINLILSYREKHPIRNIICCLYCKEEGYYLQCLHVYHRSEFRKFEIICSDCIHDFCKH